MKNAIVFWKMTSSRTYRDTDRRNGEKATTGLEDGERPPLYPRKIPLSGDRVRGVKKDSEENL